MEFLHVDTLEAARKKLLSYAGDWVFKTETILSDLALGRILSEDIFAPDNVPHFRRSSMDGYAVLSKDTAAAGESIPVFLSVLGQIEMGESASFSINSGQCVEVATGGMIPGGADAVVMMENTEIINENEVAIYSGVSFGENVVQTGEDVKSGEILLPRGKKIQPQDVGVLVAAGIIEISVYMPLKVAIISTGDELISPDKAPKAGQIRDVNTSGLTALASKYGFEVTLKTVLPDDSSVLELNIRNAMKGCDIVIVSGGSSQGKKDLTSDIFNRVSEPGVFTHGLAIKPGKPTILGFDDFTKTMLVGLPGHPVAAMIVFELLLVWLLREIYDTPEPPAVPAKVSCNIASTAGRQSFFPAKLTWSNDGYIAEPVYGKSGLISILAKADGYFSIERDVEGLIEGQTVLVHLF